MFTFFADRVKSLKPSQTIIVATKAKQMKRDGVDVVDLSLGDPILDPDYPLPECVKEAGIEAISQSKTSYTAADGIPELRKAIVEKMKRDSNLDYEIENVTVGCGAKQMIFNSLLATINHGDEVVLGAPYWVSYCDIVELFGGKPVVIETALKDSFKITAEELEAAITEKTKWFIINSPVNPTGAVYTKHELQAIADVLLKHPHVNIMSDDIYEYLLLDDDVKFFNIVSVEPKLKDRTVIVNGTAKSHAMTGWRTGYVVANKEMVKVLGKLQSQSTTNACTISQYATIAALKDGSKSSLSVVPKIKEKREIVLDLFAKVEGLDAFKPSGAFYVFSSIERLIGKTYKGEVINSCGDFCRLLIDEYYVAVTPGAAFGSKNHFRLSLSASENDVRRGAERICEFVSLIK